jgi:UDP-N-acetylglucosamine:LPS N-acetylglucosamine transferase
MPTPTRPAPPPKADVLFALSDTGGGHRAVSSALAAELTHLTNGAVTSAIADVLTHIRLPFVRSAPGIYDRLSVDFGRVYDAGFAITNSPARVRLIARAVYALGRDAIGELLQEAAPRLVVVTHPVLLAHLACWARRDFGFSYRVVTVVTDPVSFHAGWACRDVDACIVFTEAARDRLATLGVPRERIQLGGFPVHPSFDREAMTPAAARRVLGLPADRFTVLITGGLAGVGFRASLAQALDARGDTQTLVVAGHNEAMRRTLADTTDGARTRVYGPVSNMATLMAAADVVVTKAGPSTLMEALALRKPAIITRAVGAQEVDNVAYAEAQGFARWRQRDDEILQAIDAVRQEQWSWARLRLPAMTRADTAHQLLAELAVEPTSVAPAVVRTTRPVATTRPAEAVA